MGRDADLLLVAAHTMTLRLSWRPETEALRSHGSELFGAGPGCLNGKVSQMRVFATRENWAEVRLGHSFVPRCRGRRAQGQRARRKQGLRTS